MSLLRTSMTALFNFGLSKDNKSFQALTPPNKQKTSEAFTLRKLRSKKRSDPDLNT
jgi:hypothetical protein